MFNTQSLDLIDFGGGITDDNRSVKLNQYLRADNLLISSDNKLYTRPGSGLFDSYNAQLPSGIQRISHLINYSQDTSLFGVSGRNIYRYAPYDSSSQAVGTFTVTIASPAVFTLTAHGLSNGTRVILTTTGNLPAGLTPSVPYYVVSAATDTFQLSSTLAGTSINTSGFQAGTHSLYKEATWAQVTGPSSNVGLPLNVVDGRVSSFEWKNHLFLTDDQGSSIIKIYKDSSNAYQLRTAGLPEIDNDNLNTEEADMLAPAMAMANDIKANLVDHFGASYHLSAHTAAINIITAPDATNEATLLTLVGQLLSAYALHDADRLLNLPVFHDPAESAYDPTTPNSAFELTSSTTPTTIREAATRLNDLKLKSNRHITDINSHAEGFVTGNICNLANIDVSSGITIESELQRAYDLATELLSKLASHLANATQHTGASSLVIPAYPTISTPAMLASATYQLLNTYRTHQGNLAESIHFGAETSSHALAASSDYTQVYPETSLDDIFAALNDMQSKYNAHEVDDGAHVSGAGTLGTNLGIYQSDKASLSYSAFIYAFHYYYSYMVGSTEFIDQGPILTVEVETDRIQTNSITIENIPVLANGGSDNYDTSNLKIKIYRTTNAGTDFFLVGEVTNGTTTFTDDMEDAELISQEALYTTGGVVENDPPPKAKYVHLVESIAYYGNITDGSEVLPNQIRQAIADDPDSVPADFSVDLPGEVQNISSARSRPVTWTENKTFRLEGSFDELGRGSITPIAISDGIGLVAPRSVVQIEGGVLFFGQDGIYYTDAFNIQKINRNWPATYASLIRNDLAKQTITGAYDRAENRVYWAVSRAGIENDTILVLDLDYELSPESSFTFWNNDGYFFPTSLCVFDGDLIRGDKTGYVFRHNENYTTDPKIDTSTSPLLWNKKTIIWKYKSPSLDFGSNLYRKWVTHLVLKGINFGNASIQITSKNDGGKVIDTLAPIRFRENMVWGDEDIVWGTSNSIWGYGAIIDEKRKFPASSLRCSNKSIELTNAYSVVTNSDDLGQGTVNFTNKTVTLSGSVQWPLNSVDYYISFEDDSYTTEFLVTARTSDTVLTFSDSGGEAPANGTYKWLLKGYPKNERVYLDTITMEHSPFSKTQSPSTTTEAGRNA